MFPLQTVARIPLMALFLVGLLCLSSFHTAQADVLADASMWDLPQFQDPAFDANRKALSTGDLRRLQEAVESRDLNLLADVTLKDPTAL